VNITELGHNVLLPHFVRSKSPSIRSLALTELLCM